MIHALALGLLVSSLVAAGVLSPPPAAKPQPDPLLREGHRVIVVEYERQVPRDEIPPSSPPTAHHLLEDAKEKFHEAASHLPKLGQGLSSPASDAAEPHDRSAKDVICDAYGKCKKRVTELFHKAEEQIEQQTGGVATNAVDDVAGNISSVAHVGLGKAKEGAHAVAGKVKDVGGAALDNARDAGHATVDNIKDAGGAAVDNVRDVGHAAVDRAKDAGHEAIDKAKHAGHAAVETAEKAAEEMSRNLSDILRRARDVLYDAAAYVGAAEAGRATVAAAHLMGFAVAYGAMVWVTFVSSHVLAQTLPRQQFGVVQSKLYPVYFRVVAYSVGTAFLAQLVGRDRGFLAERVQCFNLGAVLGLVLANMLFLEPKATKAMFERMKVEKEEGRGVATMAMEPPATTVANATVKPPEAYDVTRTAVGTDPDAAKSRMVKLNKRLKRLNHYSSFLNVLTLMGLSWHLVHLASHLQVSS